jgi:hypothetical protein
MTSANIRLQGMAELKRKLGKLQALEHMLPAFKLGAEGIKAKLQTEPPPISPGHWKKNTTKAQKAAFFIKLRNEGKSVTGGKYSRTGSLSRRWRSAAAVRGNSLRGIVGNTTKYARYLQDKEGPQARFAKRRWRTVQAVIKTEKRAVVGLLQEQLNKLLKE